MDYVRAPLSQKKLFGFVHKKPLLTQNKDFLFYISEPYFFFLLILFESSDNNNNKWTKKNSALHWAFEITD